MTTIGKINKLIKDSLYAAWEQAADKLAEVEEEIKESARLDGRQVITFGEYAERHIEYNFTEEELTKLAKAEEIEQKTWEDYERVCKEIQNND